LVGLEDLLIEGGQAHVGAAAVLEVDGGGQCVGVGELEAGARADGGRVLGQGHVDRGDLDGEASEHRFNLLLPAFAQWGDEQLGVVGR